MGITGLLPFLENISRKCYINEFRGYTVAIDSYCWLHKGAFACAEKLVRGENTNIHIMYCLKYIQLLLDYNIKPIMVFDGQHLPAKKDTEVKRREQRKAARARGTDLLRLGKTEEARQYFRQCVDITHDMALALIKECRNRNVDCIVAPYEADAQLAYLNLQGIAQIIITEDSDLVLFGCSKILFKFSLDGSATLVERDKLYLAMKMRPDEYTFDKFRNMCIMSGCDYLDSLPGIGLKRAHKAVVMTHDPNIYNLLPRLPRYLNLRKLTVSQEYIENFKLADATIRHQIVFDPIKRELVRLTDPESSGISPEYLKNAGKMHDKDRAFQMALGNIDPFSLKIKDDWNPDVATSSINNSNSIWFKSYKKPKSPQKTPNRPSVNAKSTKNRTVTVSTENILAIQQQQMLDYDNKLTEELKIYQTMGPPSKRQKCNEETLDDTQKSELNTEIDEPELKVEICNPFMKNKPKRLSKFGVTNLEKNECVRSPFFASKSKDETNCTSETQENKKSETEQDTKECNAEHREGEDLVGTYSQSTICSNEEDDEQNVSIMDETASDSISLKTFVFNKFQKKISKSINPLASSNKTKSDSFNLSDEAEEESDKFSDRVHYFSASEDLITPTSSWSLNEATQEKNNGIESNSEDESLSNMDGRTSPVLSSPGIKKFSRNKQGNSLETFRFNSLKKKISNGTLKKHSTNVSDEKPPLEENICHSDLFPEKIMLEIGKRAEGDKESDIENLTPEESFRDVNEQSSVTNTLHYFEKSRDTTTVFACTSYNVESVTNMQEEENASDTEVCIIDEPKLTTLHQEIQSTMLVKGSFRRSNSCRSVGLSRNKKKVANQPTILSMFNKMTSKD